MSESDVCGRMNKDGPRTERMKILTSIMYTDP